jgi:hypothetical protein
VTWPGNTWLFVFENLSETAGLGVKLTCSTIRGGQLRNGVLRLFPKRKGENCRIGSSPFACRYETKSPRH